MGLRDATRDSGACRRLQACAEDQRALGPPPVAKALPQAQARRQVAERHPVKEGGVPCGQLGRPGEERAHAAVALRAGSRDCVGGGRPQSEGAPSGAARQLGGAVPVLRGRAETRAITPPADAPSKLAAQAALQSMPGLLAPRTTPEAEGARTILGAIAVRTCKRCGFVVCLETCGVKRPKPGEPLFMAQYEYDPGSPAFWKLQRLINRLEGRGE